MIELTASAINKIKELNEEDELQSVMEFGFVKPVRRALRIAVRPGGCSGFSYDMFFDREVLDHEWTQEFDGVTVVIDPESAPKLNGATLDYKEGLQGAGFTFNNPSATRSCGCGQSFS